MKTESVFDSILMNIKRMVDFNSATLLLMSRNGKKLEIVAQYGNNCNLIKAMHFKMGKGLSAWLAQKKRTICLSNIHRGARHVHNPIRSFVAIPICHNENVVGVLNLSHVIPDAYGQDEVEVLQNYLQSIAPEMVNSSK